MMKKWGGPGSMMDTINKMEELAWEERRRNPIPAPKCDGCFSRFRGTPPDEDEEDDAEDVGDAFKRCTTCDYTICENCTHLDIQGKFHGLHLPIFTADSVCPRCAIL
jgi:hypothetical protein